MEKSGDSSRQDSGIPGGERAETGAGTQRVVMGYLFPLPAVLTSICVIFVKTVMHFSVSILYSCNDTHPQRQEKATARMPCRGAANNRIPLRPCPAEGQAEGCPLFTTLSLAHPSLPELPAPGAPVWMGGGGGLSRLSSSHFPVRFFHPWRNPPGPLLHP